MVFNRKIYQRKHYQKIKARYKTGKYIPVTTNLIEHHTKYKEIDGVDESIWVTRSEHKCIHDILNNLGIKIPDEIAAKAHRRTEKRKLKKYSYKYALKNIQIIHFIETLLPNVYLIEQLVYNKSTGSINIYSRFRADHGKKLLVMV